MGTAPVVRSAAAADGGAEGGGGAPPRGALRLPGDLYGDKKEEEDGGGKGNAGGSGSGGGGGCVTEEEREQRRALQRLLEDVREHRRGREGMPHTLHGTFARLVDDATFREVLFPGVPRRQQHALPGNFQELLESSMYASHVPSVIPLAVRKAANVLKGVKARGSEGGEEMDAYTEEVLKPQILQEAFAREIVDMVRRVNTQSHRSVAKKAAIATSSAAVAAASHHDQQRPQPKSQPRHGQWEQQEQEQGQQQQQQQQPQQQRQQQPSATSQPQNMPRVAKQIADIDPDCVDQLDDDVLVDLFRHNIGFAVQDDFVGPAWFNLVQADANRFAQEEELAPFSISANNGDADADAGVSARFAWIEFADIVDTYPALAEHVHALYALPFEISLKSQNRLSLAPPVPGSTMFVVFPPGSRQPKRFDASLEGDRDNGYRITCAYHIPLPACPLAGGSGTLHLRNDSETANVAPDADRLVLFRSLHVETERDPVLLQQSGSATDNVDPDEAHPSGLAMLVFWIHGASE